MNLRCFWASCFCVLFFNPFVIGQDNLSAGQAPVPSGSKIYFKASGVDPVWSLSISPYLIEFKTQATGYETFSSPHVEPTRAMDSQVKKYSMRTEAGAMEVELTNVPCQNSNSKERFRYMVNVSLQQGSDTTYTYFNGCGDYKTDPEIEGTWVLLQMGADTVYPNQFNDTLPQLVLHARGNSFEGYGGCNTIHGRIFSERSLMRFTNLILTQRVCTTLPKEAAFVRALEFSTEYEIKDNKLMLSNPSGRTLVFTKSME